jgi:prevent-host-death family protein
MQNETSSWQIQAAKSKFSEFVSRARRSPQIITLRGVPVAVTMSMKKYNSLSDKNLNIIDFFRDSPLRGVDLDIARDKSAKMRDIKL